MFNAEDLALRLIWSTLSIPDDIDRQQTTEYWFLTDAERAEVDKAINTVYDRIRLFLVESTANVERQEDA